ncbi:MAG: hypothetical protein ACRD0Z_04040 [Acidimicrobiales bacterium]
MEKTKHSFTKRLLAVTCGAAVVALAAGGVALATTPPSAKPAPTASSAPAAGNSAPTSGNLRHDAGRLARHTVHATLIVHTGHGYQTIDIDRGTLSTDSSNSISIVRPDGPPVSATITSSTKFRGLAESKLAKDDRVVLVQGSGHKAIVVWARPPAAAKG